MQNVKEPLSRDLFRTPWGWVGAVYTPRGLRRLGLPLTSRPAAARAVGLPPGAAPEPWPALRAAVCAYLSGEGAPPAPPLDLPPATAFTARVRRALLATLPGETLSYGELARRAGSPAAARAVGRVMAANPVPLAIPCHRVVAADRPGGYAGGPALKARLLALEARRGPTA